MSEDSISEQNNLLIRFIMNQKPVNANIGYTLPGEVSPSPQKTETQVSPTDTTGQIIQAGESLLGQGGAVPIILCLCLLTYLFTSFAREVKKD